MTSPRLKSLVVRDFRSISGEWTVPLDADVVLIHGQNGAGKTSLLSALELAATGSISYLDRIGDDDYLSHLHHRGTKAGQVKVEVSGGLAQGVGNAVVSAKGAACQPLLDDRLSEAFVERCFLPQATLGRLFEVYAPKGSGGADTPLIRFVKEVLGLDSLDALIDGLYSAAHVTRIEKLSAGWTRAASVSDQLALRSRSGIAARTGAQSRLEAATTALAVRLGLDEFAAGKPDEINAAAVRLVASQADLDLEIARVREAQLRLDAVESTLAQNNLIDADPNQPANELDTVAAERRFEDWRLSRAAPLREWFESGERDAPDAAEPSTLLRVLRQEISDLEISLANLRRSQAAARGLDERTAIVRRRMDEVSRGLGELARARNAASTSSAATGLASLLVSLLEHVDGEVCPVCEQDYLRAGSLRDHILAKVETLDVDAGRLLEMETRRSEREAEQTALQSELVDLEARREQLGEALALDADADSLERRLGQLRELEPIGEAGQILTNEITRLRETEARSVRGRSLLSSCLADLEQIAASLGVTQPRGLLTQRIAALRASARGDLEDLEGRQRQLTDVLRLRSEIGEASALLDNAVAQVSEIGRETAALAREIKEAKRRKEVASRLRKQAEALRTATITGVFDDHLNGSWKHIFGALVPSEPFVPQFKKIPDGSRQVSVDIETVHRDGLEGATPAAMLSQGNLNTAALSLFIALHFAVPEELPWLIFDDPVQSMDDLHVSNFASMIKQLTRRYGRQVVIAVHERELFDYLALELSPASPGEELLTVVLDRTYGESIITSTRITHREDTALSPSPAA